MRKIICVALRGRYINNKNKLTKQQLEINNTGGQISNTITSLEKDNYIIEIEKNEQEVGIE